ncbi:MAG: response regulator [Lachnospiraceae bacterium]|nr:response regulator [Lachnospiraceae bacterium]
MYKVAIIDDEPLIVEGLSKTMAWEKWDCQVAGYAYDGREGMELIRSKRPDIIITDINMPEMDGLKMIAGLKSEFPDMQLIILTGYREFEYARRAIELGVSRFLLKPSKMNELEEAMEAVTKRLEQADTFVDASSYDGNGVRENDMEKQEDSSKDAEETENNEANSFIVKNALEYIRENSQEKLRLTDVADQVYVSQWHLSKLLNKHTGKTFSDILNGARMDKSKELLKDPSLRICDVAEMVGFQDLAHFSRVFKKMEGMSANEYRNTH